ncbi:MAG: PEPxxWA-CTERM sorting domain-containing protein [Sphingomonadaceae bacterium]
MSAFAAVNITSTGTDPTSLGVSISFQGNNNQAIPAGRFSLQGTLVPSGDSASYLSYCADLLLGLTPGLFDHRPVSFLFGPTKTAQLTALVGNADPLITGNTPLDQEISAAIQLAIWEIIGETATSNYSLTSGLFEATGATPNALALTQTYLDNVSNGTWLAVPGTDVQLLYSVTNQSQIFRGPGAVPEPTTWAMMICGFGVIGATVRRRRAITATATLA